MRSKFFNLDLTDFERGLLVAVVTGALTILYQSVSAGGFVINWEAVLAAAATSGIAYLLKNLGTNSEDKILKPEPK